MRSSAKSDYLHFICITVDKCHTSLMLNIRKKVFNRLVLGVTQTHESEDFEVERNHYLNSMEYNPPLRKKSPFRRLQIFSQTELKTL